MGVSDPTAMISSHRLISLATAVIAGTPALPAQADPAGAALVRIINEHAVPIRTLEPEAKDCSDLLPILPFLRGVQVLQIGEASHGDGATFVLRRRLIRFLHQRAGYDVLAWESGLAGVAELEADLHGDRPVAELANGRLARPWARSHHCLPILDYARSTHTTTNPLELAGFDSQFGNLKTITTLGTRVADLLQPQALTDEERSTLGSLSRALMTMQSAPEDTRHALLKTIDGLVEKLDTIDEITAPCSPRELRFTQRCFWSYARFLGLLDHLMSLDGKADSAANNPRDLAMGSNLVWLARERYPDRRIVSWVASYHALHGLAEIELEDGSRAFAGAITAGDVAHRELGDGLYTIAVLAYGGTTSSMRKGPSKLEPAPPGSLEELCHRSGHQLLFLDLRRLPDGHTLRRVFAARPLGRSPMRLNWSEHADGILFIDEMFAASDR